MDGSDDREGASAAGAVPPGLLLAAVACAGTAVMVVEMTAVRALQPYFGSTTLVWSHVIAVVLAALALGGWQGGRWADRDPSPRRLFGLLGAGGLLVAGAAAAAGPAARLFLTGGLDMEGLAGTLSRGALGTTLLVFAPPLYLLGAVSPLAIRLLAGGGVGRAAGRVYALSTAGAIAGTYLPGLLLVPLLGTRGTLLAAAALLLLPAAAGWLRCGGGRRDAAVALLLAAAAGAAARAGPVRPPPPLPPEGGTATLLAERESAYQYLCVREQRGGIYRPMRALCINEGVYTYHALDLAGGPLTGSRYYDDAAILPLLLDRAPGTPIRAAVLGFACGSNARAWRHFWSPFHPLEISGAEIDPEVLALGREYFAAPEEPSVAVADGRPWLAALPAGTTFDLLAVDAFAQEVYVPFHLATREFFDLCRSRLAPGGILAFAVFGIGADAPNVAAVEATLAASFGHGLRSARYGDAGYLFLARNGDAPPDADLLEARGARARYPGLRDLPEGGDLLALAGVVREASRPLSPLPGAPVLTDDDVPLERLTDRALAAEGERIRSGLRGGPGAGAVADRAAAARSLDLRHLALLGVLAAAWAAVAVRGTRGAA